MDATTQITLIDIRPRQTRVVTGYGSSSEATVECALGSSITAEQYFKSDPPTGPELEHAIDAVEDEIMRLRTIVPAGSELVASGGALRELGHAASETGRGGLVKVAMVEQVFQRIASTSLGDPMARQGLPGGNAFVASALILREFMHHMGYATVTVDAQMH